MTPQQTIAIYILDKTGTPIGIAFPFKIGDTAITGMETWKLYLRDQEILEREHALLLGYARGEVLYEEVRHLVEEETLPEPECSCFLPEQTCFACSDRASIGDLKMVGEEIHSNDN